MIKVKLSKEFKWNIIIGQVLQSIFSEEQSTLFPIPTIIGYLDVIHGQTSSSPIQ